MPSGVRGVGENFPYSIFMLMEYSLELVAQVLVDS